MDIHRKNIDAATVIEASTELSISEIAAYAEKTIPELLAEAQDRGMAVTGPCVFTYEDCDGEVDNRFSLKIAFPVDACRGQGAFPCVQVPAHSCLCTVHTGPMKGIGPAWNEFTPLALQQGETLRAIGREVYLNWVDQSSAENQVELQIPVLE
jgi:effector-binding domain-containing protein